MLHKRGRKVFNRSPHRRVGFIACSWFQEDYLEYESLLELSFARIALLCPGLTRIQSQPFVDLPGFPKYTPDFRLDFDASPTMFVEVKPSVHLERHRQALNAAGTILKSHGFQFLIATDDLIHHQDRHVRASVFIRYARSHHSPHVVEMAMSRVVAHGLPSALCELEAAGVCSVELLRHLVGIRRLVVEPSLEGLSLNVPNCHENLLPASWLNSSEGRAATDIRPRFRWQPSPVRRHPYARDFNFQGKSSYSSN